MKLLIINSYFPVLNNVSAKRIKSFYDFFRSKGWDVNVVMFSDSVTAESRKDDFIYLPLSLVGGLISTIINLRKIFIILKNDAKEADFVIISTPMFQLCLLIFLFRKRSKIIFDLRDHPNLIYYHKLSTAKGVRLIIIWLEHILRCFLVYSSSRFAKIVLTVGEMSKSFYYKKVPGVCKDKIHNIHNGFNVSDYALIRDNKFTINSNLGCKLCIVGNLHNFRYGHDFNKMIFSLNAIRDGFDEVCVDHYGKCDDLFLDDIKEAKFAYNTKRSVEREVLLKKLGRYDAFILVTSEKLIWEPTTTVFDYVLFNKPVVFIGNRNNEAYKILKENKMKIVNVDEVIDIREVLYEEKTDVLNHNLKDEFSRDFQNEKLFRILEKYFNK